MMKKLIALLLALTMVAALFVGCAKDEKPTEEVKPTDDAVVTDAPTDTNEPVVNTDPIKIGSIQDLSGSASIAGQPQAWGVEYAVRLINENGGINGRPIELYTRDCQNDAEVGVTCYRELVDEIGVCAIIGPALSNPASAWVELATEDEIPIVGHFMDDLCTTDPDTGDAYPYMFLAEPSCAVQSYIVAEYAMKTLNVKTVATLYNTSNAFAVAHEAPFVDYMKNNDGEVLAEETFGWTDTDYSAQAQKIAALNPDAVFLCDYAAQVSVAYDNLRDAGYTGIILGANTLCTPFDTLVKNEIKDVYFVQNYDLPEGKIGELTDIHMKETGTAFRSTNVGFGWDAMQVLANAMLQATDPTDGAEVRNILENNTVNVESCGGEMITIDPAIHRPTREMKMYIASYDESGALVYLDLLSSDYKAN